MALWTEGLGFVGLWLFDLPYRTKQQASSIEGFCVFFSGGGFGCLGPQTLARTSGTSGGLWWLSQRGVFLGSGCFELFLGAMNFLNGGRAGGAPRAFQG